MATYDDDGSRIATYTGDGDRISYSSEDRADQMEADSWRSGTYPDGATYQVKAAGFDTVSGGGGQPFMTLFPYDPNADYSPYAHYGAGGYYEFKKLIEQYNPGGAWVDGDHGLVQYNAAPGTVINYPPKLTGDSGGWMEKSGWMIPLALAGMEFGGLLGAEGGGSIGAAGGGAWGAATAEEMAAALAADATAFGTGTGAFGLEAAASPNWWETMKNFFTPSPTSAATNAATSAFTNSTGGGGEGTGGTLGTGDTGADSGGWNWLKILGGTGSGMGQGGLLSTALGLGGGLYGLSRAGDLRDLASQASAQQDPFAPYRSQYAQKLSNLYANPGNVTGLPGYQAGLDAVTRKMASQGYLGSGNMMTALQDYGGRAFDAEASRLMQLSGANFAPSGGAALLSGNINANSLANQSLNSLGYGVRGLESLFRSM